MKTLKKITAVILCFAFILGSFSMAASSIGYDNATRGELRTKFQQGEGPAVLGMDLDYSYYCPDTDNPCPLIIYMNGAGNGTYRGKEIEGTDIIYWACEEFQAETENADGMYIMVLRSPDPVYFDTYPLARCTRR